MKQVFIGDWDWLVGKIFSLGEVVSVLGSTATVQRGDDIFRILVCELLEEHDKNNMPIEGFLGDRLTKSTIKTYDIAISKVTMPDEKMWHPRFDVCYTFETIEDAKAFQKRMEMREYDDNAKIPAK